MTSAPTILLVDEEPLLRRATALLLTNRGGRVSSVATLAEAVVLTGEQLFDVAVLDVSPEGPSAAVMLGLLRARGLLPRRFVVCLPGAPQEENDFTVVLQKPYPFDTLVAAVFGPERARRPARSGVFALDRDKIGALLSIRPTRRASRAHRDRG
jgi:DNA-binding response OmpR family regulator